MVRLYLDTSLYNRPFDDQSQPKIFLETQAVVIVLQMVESGAAELVSSTALAYENSRNPYADRQKATECYLALASVYQVLDDSIRLRAKELEAQGVQALDALHVASAEAAGCDYLLTCDRRLINRCQSLTLRVINPTDFVVEVDDDDSSIE